MNKPFTLDKPGIAQSYLFGRFVQDAKRPTKIPFFIRDNGPDSLWLTLLLAVILQIGWPAASLAPWGVRPNAKAKAADLNQFAIVLVTFPSEKLES